MKAVQALIEKKVAEMVQESIQFRFLNDASISATDRLRRVSPVLAYFVMGFADLQTILEYPYEEANVDPLKVTI